MENNNNNNFHLDRFEGRCINDYVQFLLSFYYTVLPPQNYIELKNILYSYISEGHFKAELLNSSNNSKNLQNFFITNGSKFRNFPMLQEFHKRNKNYASNPKRPHLAAQSNNQMDENDNRFSSFARGREKKKKHKDVNVTLYENNGITPRTRLLQVLPPFNKRENFRNIKTAGEHSNMMVSSNGNFFFKAFSELDLLKKRQFENECIVYLHLQKENSDFIRDSTCLVACYSDGILLRNGGMSLQQLLVSHQQLNPQVLRQNLQQFFPTVLHLHCSGVNHNDLHCHNVVGFDKTNDVRLIDFGFAKICRDKLDIDFLRRLNIVFAKIFFSFAKKYKLF